MKYDGVILGAIIGIIVAGSLFLLLSRIPIQSPRLFTASPRPKTTYKNTEEWEIIKNRSGRTTGVRVKRTASES